MAGHVKNIKNNQYPVFWLLKSDKKPAYNC